MRRKLYLVTDKPGEPEYLSDKCEGFATAREVADRDIEPVELAMLMDDEAAATGHDDFVGTHQYLCDVVEQHADEVVALHVMMDLFQSGGLHDLP